MKIGIVCYPTYGGSGVVATELGKNLAKLGHEIHFMSYAIPYRLTEYDEQIIYHEVKVLEYPLFVYPPYSLALATKMAEIAKYQNLDILHVHYAVPHAISAYLAKEMIKEHHDIKIITTLHGTDITLVGKDPSYLEVTRFGIEKSDGVTAVSKYLRDKTVETFNITKSIDVIYNFIEKKTDQERRCDSIRKKIAPNNEKIISHLSNFRPVKRIVDVIETAYRVLKKIPIKVIMIGDGPERSHAEMRARELGIDKHVFFLGKQENVYLLLSSSHVFLMPSSLESFGLAALEAMACGLPCVTSNVGGLPELVKEGVSGFTVSLGNVDEMAAKVIKILDNENYYNKLSDSTRKYAFENFHVDKIIPQYLAIYKRFVK